MPHSNNISNFNTKSFVLFQFFVNVSVFGPENEPVYLKSNFYNWPKIKQG